MDAVSFDFWTGRPPGEDPSEWFYKTYPREGYPELGGANKQLGDPSGSNPDCLYAIPPKR